MRFCRIKIKKKNDKKASNNLIFHISTVKPIGKQHYYIHLCFEKWFQI